MITVTASAHCIGRCDWTAAGTAADVDRQADKHTRQAGHPTCTVTTPTGRTAT